MYMTLYMYSTLEGIHKVQSSFVHQACISYLNVPFVCLFVCFQQEKIRLIEKAKEDDKLKQKASISIPLVDEHSEDIQTAKTTCFTASSSVEDRKRKRLEIRSQSLFRDSSSSTMDSGSTANKQARLTLMKACGLSKRKTGTGGSNSVRGIRNSLGIRTGSSVAGTSTKQ